MLMSRFRMNMESRLRSKRDAEGFVRACDAFNPVNIPAQRCSRRRCRVIPNGKPLAFPVYGDAQVVLTLRVMLWLAINQSIKRLDLAVAQLRNGDVRTCAVNRLDSDTK